MWNGLLTEKENEFRYCWEESITLLSVGTDYSSTILEPMTVTFDGLAETIPEFSYAESLYDDYGIILSDEGGVSWTKEYSYALYEMIKRLGLNFHDGTNDYRGDSLPYSKWTLTDDLVVDDISITTSAASFLIKPSDAPWLSINLKSVIPNSFKRSVIYSAVL